MNIMNLEDMMDNVKNAIGRMVIIYSNERKESVLLFLFFPIWIQYMKIVRLGMSESDLLIFHYVMKYHKESLPSDIKQRISKSTMTMLNWLYTTSGYYDKDVSGNYFNFEPTALTPNYRRFLADLEMSIGDCQETQFILHALPADLLRHFLEPFCTHYRISNLCILNDIPFEEKMQQYFPFINGRKVLIISSFAELIKQQFHSGNLRRIYPQYPDYPVIAQMETYTFPYCFMNHGDKQNYFETLDQVYQDIKDKDFDVALLGCGAYGHKLCHLIHTELKKDAIYLGGAIQLFFGIMSEREKKANNPIPTNESWIMNVPKKYKPPNYKLIEEGCYW